MPGIDPAIACHRLNISEGYKPVMQKPRKMAPKRKAKVAEEIERMLEARIIEPVRYPKWLADIVAVPKKNGKIRPEDMQTIYIYLAASEYAVTAVLFVREPDKKPVYFVRKSLTDAETTYSQIEKMALALMHAARRLKPYFEGRRLVVYTEYPLKKVLGRTDDSSRLATWATYLGAYTIDYEPRTSEKGHAVSSLMTDFPVDDIEVYESIVDEEILHEAENVLPIPLPWEHLKVSKKASKEIDVQTSIKESMLIPEKDNGVWKIYTDGSENTDGAGVGCVLVSPEGLQIEKAIRLGFTASNNQAEYEAAISGLKTALHLGARKVVLTTNSRLVVNQFIGAYIIRNEKLASYLEYISELAKEFEYFRIEQKPKLENRHADALAYLSAAVESDTTRFIVVDFQELPSIHNNVAAAHRIFANEIGNGSSEAQHDPIDTDETLNDQSEDWRQRYIRYLQTQELPDDKYKAGKITKTVWRYTMIEDELYKKPIAMEPYLRCVTQDTGKQLLDEAHEGCCGNHSGGRSLEHRLLSQGYFWPYMQNDAKEYMKKCMECQLHVPLIKRPANELHPVNSPWPFSKWGLDIIGPFPTAPGGVKYLLVATDYFTKWVEAVALVRTEAAHVHRFIRENIICRFGVPAMIVSDNGKQFDSETIKSLHEGLHINHNFSTPYYAQSNGQATTPRRSTGFSPFTLAYGTEVVLPIKLLVPTTKTLAEHSGQNTEILSKDKEFLDEVRDEASKRLAIYQQSMKQQYNKKVRERSFVPGEEVLRRTRPKSLDASGGKLEENWEGPYLVEKLASGGAYWLRNMSGKMEHKP
ncbi:uncharacterized protein LOC113295283 [Papaver somniferum]|uniref:uncharacterized protein LOC113295283 n=1 Tax=Papaver somniferum TaxID=3469 RepID=UPI000E703968|nr:uncharacterized protein LOC113295283 [Papaver somniferum]